MNESAMLYSNKNITVDYPDHSRITYQLIAQDGDIGFTPSTQQGTYDINLTINDEVTISTTLTINCWDDDYIYTVPNPSLPNQLVTVYYGYSYATYNARLRILATGDEWTIFPQTSGSKETRFSNSGLYKIDLDQYNNITRTYINIAEYYHSVSGAISDSISINPTAIELTEYTTITGYHTHVGNDVYVLSNGEIIQYVGEYADFSFRYYPEEEDRYQIRLILIDNEGQYITLDTADYLDVGDISADEEDEGFFDQVLGENKIWLGAMIIISFMLFPFGVSLKAGIPAPPVLYVALGCLGTAIAVELQLLDSSYLLVMLVATISGAVITYIRGHI